MGVCGPEDPDDIYQQSVSPGLAAVVAVPIDLHCFFIVCLIEIRWTGVAVVVQRGFDIIDEVC
jgi:hypothetical protein